MRLGQTSVIYLVAKLLGSVLGFVATIYFTRLLGEEIYGFYAITLALVSWLGIIKSLGFGSAIVKRMSEGEEPDAYLAAGTTIKGVLTLLISLGVLVFHEQVNAYVGAPVAEFVVLLLIASIFKSLVSSALKGTHRVHIYAPLSTAKQGLRSAIMIFFVFIGWELSGMLLGHAVGTALIAAIGLAIVRPKLVVPQWRHITSLFDYAKFAWLGSMRKKTFSDMDIIVLGFFVSAGLTGIYAVAYTLAKFLDIFGDAIGNTLFPEMSKQSANDDDGMVSTLTNDALAFGGLFLIPGFIGAAILGDRLMLIYGPGFDRGAHILTILLLGILIYSYNKQLLNTLNAIDRPDLSFRSNTIFILSNLLLNIVLVWQIGWTGAAVGTAASAGCGMVATYYYATTQIEFAIPTGEMTRQWVAAILMGLFVYTTRQVGESSWLAEYNVPFVLVLVGLGATVYFLILLGISSRFRNTINRNLPFNVPLLG